MTALPIFQLKEDFCLYDFNMVDHTNTKSKRKKPPPPKKVVLQLHAKEQYRQLELLFYTVSIL